jgi:hypothetical protein
MSFTSSPRRPTMIAPTVTIVVGCASYSVEKASMTRRNAIVRPRVIATAMRA